jgi:hypothetical protein
LSGFGFGPLFNGCIIGVGPSSITATGFSDSPGEGIFSERFGNLVDMVGHKAVSPYLHSTFSAPFSHEGDLFLAVLVTKEDLLAMIVAMGNVMGRAGGY